MKAQRSPGSSSEPVPAPLARAGAQAYAAWFGALGDPTRVQLVSVLARSGRALSVGEIVTALGVSQSTVSQHLKVLADVRFVLADRRGTARHYRLNGACLDLFPTAAGLVTGRTPPSPRGFAAPRAEPAAGPADAGQPQQGAAAGSRTLLSGSGAGEILIRPMRPADATAVLAIYQAGLDSGQASFETAAPSWDRFDASKLPAHRHVAATASGQVLGWVAVSPVSDRCAYAGVVEHSVYVDPAARGRGAGTALLRELIQSTEAAGIWTIQSGIFPENIASLRLHERAGFRRVGTRQHVGRQHGRWRDVVLIERRSPVAGTG
jgi:L-amino acid N-acyltransferase YncA/DNA-binding transcriptional ArsR family regulator